MLRPGSAALVTLAATIASSAPAEADRTQVGIWFGPRVFSSDSYLGYIEDAPHHPMLENAISFGVRVGRPFLPWLVPEIELAMSPTSTTPAGGAPSVDVFWLDPRLQLRFEILPGRRLQPFVIVGGGSPIALSSARQTFDSGIVGDGFVGGGARFDTTKGFLIRADARASFLPGADALVTVEVEVGFGLEFQFGDKRRPTAEQIQIAKGGPPPDKDADKIPDAQDRCPDRAEDVDNHEDTDGCPDIDNDLDRILDIADKCVAEPEKYNGFEDEDGCPDTLPSEVDALRGTVEGLIYAEGETVVRDSALPNIRKIVKLMTSQPTIRVVLIGHADDREAKQFIEKGKPADLDALSADLSRARAEAVKQVLVGEGIAATRVDVEGHGSEEPVVDNDKPRGRLANRRVEIKLYVPPSSK